MIFDCENCRGEIQAMISSYMIRTLSFMFSFRCNSHRTRVQLYARASDVIIDTKCTCHPSNLVGRWPVRSMMLVPDYV
jgi:hypothetical protein